MFLVQLTTAFIIGGFFLIAVAPLFKIFRKAGKPGWRCLIPGANVYTYITITGKPVLIAGAVSFLALLAFFVMKGLIVFHGGFFEDALTVLSLLLILALVTLLFPYPLLSTVMALTVSFLGPYQGPGLIAAIVLLGLAAVQCGWDLLGWVSLFKKMNRPFWQLVFLFPPTAVALTTAVLTLAGAPVDLALILWGFVPAMFIGLVYLYYLGYSVKVVFKN